MWAAISKLLTAALKSSTLASWLPTLIIDKVLKPAFKYLYNWIMRKIEERKKRKDVTAKVSNYKESNEDNFDDTFDDLP